MSDQPVETLTTRQIQALLREARRSFTSTNTRARVRRNLLIRDAPDIMDNLTGTYLPPPFDQTALAIRTMVGETAKAVQHYASRLSANTPKLAVTPTTTKTEITKTVDRESGDQERMDMQMWEECGGRQVQWEVGMHQSMNAVGYILTLPRDADFGLPDRVYYDVSSDTELETLRREGKVTPGRIKHPKTGQLIYAEHNDVWAARRNVSSKYRAESGRSLFTLQAYPRDQVYAWRDKDGMKGAAIIEEVAGSECAYPGTEYAMHFARAKGVPEDDINLWGIWTDRQGNIVGGIDKGAPPDSTWTRPTSFTIVRFFNRVEQVVLIGGSNSLEGAVEIYRGKHGCKRGGIPWCPVVEVPMMRTGVNLPGAEFTTPMEPVFAYVPIINQLLTILSNATAFNGIPRWAIETQDGQILRGEDGTPKQLNMDDFVPGLSPDEAVTINGKLIQVLIDTKSIQELLTAYMERLDACMPAPVTLGQSGSSAAAWQVRQLIQQGQETLRQGVDNQAAAVKEIVQLWHGWMRDLDVPIYFFPAPGKRYDKRTQRNLIEFDPKNLTDSFTVVQELDTPDEATVLLQQGIELLQGRLIDLEEFYEKYAREQDVRAAIKRKFKADLKDYWWTGALPPLPPGAQPSELPMVKVLGDGMRGRIFYQLLQRAPHFADQVAQDMAMSANQQAQQMLAPPPDVGIGGGPGGTPNVAQPAGMTMPGQGMAPTLPQQLGSNQPGGNAPPAPAGG